MNDEVKVIEGEVFTDHRGRITSVNGFHLEGARRMYFIHHPDVEVVRGWHGHRWERKWFYCVKGTFELAVVKIDDWHRPSAHLKPQIFRLSEQESRIVCVPPGYANCMRTDTAHSVMMVLSGEVLPDAYADSWRYPPTLWTDWVKEEDVK
ncbi:MAG: WxcM-like domain-containing protein [Muribaculaceae bacterium]|nr:WxcM-like domain-containing protein [Muribaculaceae bacterium]